MRGGGEIREGEEEMGGRKGRGGGHKRGHPNSPG